MLKPLAGERRSAGGVGSTPAPAWRRALTMAMDGTAPHGAEILANSQPQPGWRGSRADGNVIVERRGRLNNRCFKSGCDSYIKGAAGYDRSRKSRVSRKPNKPFGVLWPAIQYRQKTGNRRSEETKPDPGGVSAAHHGAESSTKPRRSYRRGFSCAPYLRTHVGASLTSLSCSRWTCSKTLEERDVIAGNWLVDPCGTTDPGIDRIARWCDERRKQAATCDRI